MKKIFGILCILLLFTSCDQFVSKKDYENKNQQVHDVWSYYNELHQEYFKLSQKEQSLENEIEELESQLSDLKENAECAYNQFSEVCSDYNNIINGHFALTWNDIVDDLKDVESALNGSSRVFYRSRSFNGIPY